jgi:hypothetical protein
MSPYGVNELSRYSVFRSEQCLWSRKRLELGGSAREPAFS